MDSEPGVCDDDEERDGAAAEDGRGVRRETGFGLQTMCSLQSIVARLLYAKSGRKPRYR